MLLDLTNKKIIIFITLLNLEIEREFRAEFVERSEDWNVDDWPELIIAVIAT